MAPSCWLIAVMRPLLVLTLLAVVCASLGKALAAPGVRGGRRPLGRVQKEGADGASELRMRVPSGALAW